MGVPQGRGCVFVTRSHLVLRPVVLTPGLCLISPCRKVTVSLLVVGNGCGEIFWDPLRFLFLSGPRCADHLHFSPEECHFTLIRCHSLPLLLQVLAFSASEGEATPPKIWSHCWPSRESWPAEPCASKPSRLPGTVGRRFGGLWEAGHWGTLWPLGLNGGAGSRAPAAWLPFRTLAADVRLSLTH